MHKGVIVKRDVYIACAIAGGLLLLLILFYFAFYAPKTTALEELRGTIALKTAELDQARMIAARREMLEQSLADLQEIVDAFEQRLPSEEELSRLTQTLNATGFEAGVKRIEVERLKVVTKTDYNEVPFLIKASGPYHGVSQFVNLLETAERYFKISELKIGPEENGYSEAQFKLTTFKFTHTPPAPDKADVAAKAGEASSKV